MRTMIALLVALATVLTASGLAAAQTIKMGAALALTGPFSKEGKLVKDGYDFWLAEVNKRGGIMVDGKRRPVEIVFYDDESNAQTSARLTEKLITEDKVRFLLGPFSSPITMQTSVIGEKYKILTMATQANADAIYERGFKYVISVLPPATAYMKMTLEMAGKLQPRPKTVAIMALNNPFGILAAEGARNHAKANGFDVVYFEKYPAQASDVSPFLTQIKAKNPDILVASGFFQESLLIVKQSKELKFCPKMIALTVGPDVPDFTKSLGKDAEYIFGSAWWLPNMGYKGRDFGSSRDYSKAVTERLGREPNYHVASGTAAGLFLQMAIEKANSLDTDKVRAAFRTMDIETFWGPTAWNDKGQNIKGASGPIQIQNGKLVSVYPEKLREVPAAYPMPCWDKR